MPSSSKSPAFSAAVRTCSISAAVTSGAKNGRPVLVQMAPGPGKPKREPAALLAGAAAAALLAGAAAAALLAGAAAAAGAERHTSSTAREPMCFSSHSTDATPSAR